MDAILSLLHIVFAAVVSLFPPVNPLGTALIVDPFLHHLNPQERKQAAIKLTLYCFLICVSTVIIGSWIFKLFGISLPVVQFAGGLLICQMGWRLLDSKDSADSKSTPQENPDTSRNVEDILFYPLAFPMTTGAGSIAVLLTLSAHGHNEDTEVYFMNLAAIFLAIVIVCAMIYLSYAFTPAILKRLGERGELIVNKLGAFLVFCVGLQIAVGGAQGIIGHQ